MRSVVALGNVVTYSVVASHFVQFAQCRSDVTVGAFVSHCSDPQMRSDEHTRSLVSVFAVLMYCEDVQVVSVEHTRSLDVVAIVDSYCEE